MHTAETSALHNLNKLENILTVFFNYRETLLTLKKRVLDKQSVTFATEHFSLVLIFS
jgi:hypothetical protein